MQLIIDISPEAEGQLKALAEKRSLGNVAAVAAMIISDYIFSASKKKRPHVPDSEDKIFAEILSYCMRPDAELCCGLSDFYPKLNLGNWSHLNISTRIRLGRRLADYADRPDSCITKAPRTSGQPVIYLKSKTV